MFEIYDQTGKLLYTTDADGAANFRNDPRFTVTPVVAKPPVPASVSPRQLKLALYGAGLLDKIEAFVASADKSVQISWEYTTQFERTNPLLNQMIDSFGMTHDQADDLFRTAAGL